METILFLHGWGGDEHSFANIIPALSKHFRCLTLSMPMFQKEDSEPREPWTLENYADFVEKFLNTHDVEKCHILAHSFGCRVATLLVTRHPSRYGKLVLTGAAGIRAKRSLKTRIKIRFHKLGIKKSKGSIDYQKLNDSGKITFQNVLRHDLKFEISKIQSETLLIFGRDDTATPVWMGKKWERISPHAQLKIYESAGHFAYIDDPKHFLSHTLAFLLT